MFFYSQIKAFRLPIGVKIGLSFAVVGILFLLVVWKYHQTVFVVQSDYERLLNVAEAEKSHLLNINIMMLHARRAEKVFLAGKQELMVENVQAFIDQAIEEVSALKAIDSHGKEQWMCFVASFHGDDEKLN